MRKKIAPGYFSNKYGIHKANNSLEIRINKIPFSKAFSDLDFQLRNLKLTQIWSGSSRPWRQNNNVSLELRLETSTRGFLIVTAQLECHLNLFAKYIGLLKVQNLIAHANWSFDSRLYNIVGVSIVTFRKLNCWSSLSDGVDWVLNI